MIDKITKKRRKRREREKNIDAFALEICQMNMIRIILYPDTYRYILFETRSKIKVRKKIKKCLNCVLVRACCLKLFLSPTHF